LHPGDAQAQTQYLWERTHTVYLELLVETSHLGFIKAFYLCPLFYLNCTVLGSTDIKGKEEPVRISEVVREALNKDVLKCVISVEMPR